MESLYVTYKYEKKEIIDFIKKIRIIKEDEKNLFFYIMFSDVFTNTITNTKN